MSKTWKWILGIVAVLVVVSVVGFVAMGTFMSHYANTGNFENFQHPMMSDRYDGQMPQGYDNFRSPMGGFNHGKPMHGGRSFGGYGFMPLPFLFYGGLLRLLFPLGVLGAVGYFSYKKGKQDGMAVAAVPVQESE